MNTVEIYLKGELVKVDQFRRDCYILQNRDSNELILRFDEDTTTVGIIKSWIQLADTDPKILFVLPDWQLVVDGEFKESKFYQDVVDLSGKKVELIYDNYRFVFNFVRHRTSSEQGV